MVSLRLGIVALAGLALTVAAWPASSFHTADPLVASASSPGPAGFGIRVDTPTGHIVIDVLAGGPNTGSTSGMGAFLYDENKNLQFGIAVTSHGSPDRFISQVGPSGPVNEPPPGVEVRLNDPAEDGACVFACLGLTVDVGAAATRFFATWAANLGPTQAQVRGDAGTTAVINTGGALAIGDPEIVDGSVNVQIQQTPVPGTSLGVKVMSGANAGVAVGSGLIGFWGYIDFKIVCAVVTCFIPSSLVDLACFLTIGMPCTTEVSWDGPGGAGGTGQQVYVLDKTPPGDTVFNVDRKVDIYSTKAVFLAPGGIFVALFPFENFSFLNAADVALPA